MTVATFPAFAPLAAKTYLSRSPASAHARIAATERLLERAIVIPGLNRGFGLDAVLGFVPVAGDLVTGALGLYLVWEAWNLKLPKRILVRMLTNIGVDTVLGMVPVVGDVSDLFFRSNSRNLALIKRHLR